MTAARGYAVLIYLLAAAILTWPLALNLTSRLGALQDVGDPFLNLWILGWGLRAWTGDPGSVLSGRVFDANIFHPAEGTLTYSDHFLLQALALAPVYAAGGSAVLCYNLLLIGSIALSGLAMHALVRMLTGSVAAAYVAGLAWACWPYRTAHLLHIQLQALYFMPLALLFLHRVVAGRRWRDALALALVTALQAVASVYYGLMTGIALVVAGVALAVATGQWRARRLWTRLAAAAVLAAALTAPVVVPYMRSQQSEGFGRTLFEASNHAAALPSYTQVPPVNLVYGTTGLLDPRPVRAGERDRRSVEHQMFPGVALLILAAIGLWRGWRSDARPLAMAGAALVACGAVLSLGPEGVRALYAMLYDNVYGFQAIRAPARFAVVAMLGAALLAGLGMQRLRARTIAAVLAGVMGVEYLNAPLPLAAAPPARTPVGEWLAREPAAGAVLYLPLAGDIENTPFMVESLEHGRPIVNGYSGQRPAFFSALVESVSDLPSPNAYAALREIDVRFVVSPSPIAGAGDAASPLVERARFEGRTIYEVRWSPAALAALETLALPPPPPPGPAPFRADETARYDVYWEGGPLNVPAGTATLTVLEGGDDRAWAFEVRAHTAGWVSSFFEARDRFVTTTDADLRPTAHAREIREGRRALDRTYLYDHDARHVRIGETRAAAAAPEALTLPLNAPGARDALSALYYVRTLPLTPGTISNLPINEAGTNMVLQVAVGEIETIDHNGAGVRAWRLEPRLMRRIERRRPVRMTIWLSADDRRVPLRALVDAGFGRIRLELVDYRR